MTITVEQLSAYFDGELAAEECRAVDAHLPGCPECRTALERWRAVSRGLASAGTRAAVRRAPAMALVALAALLLASGIAVAGPFNEIFRTGNLSAVGSRPVTLEEARVADLPLPRTTQLTGGWTVDQVQLVVTPTWRSVDVQYRRPGSRGMGVTAWSQGITVAPAIERRELVAVGAVPVELGYAGESVTARFTHEGSTVIIRGFVNEIDERGMRALVAAWLEQAR